MYVIHRNLPLRLPSRTWVCSSEDQVQRVCNSPWVTGTLVASDMQGIDCTLGQEIWCSYGFFLASGSSAPTGIMYGSGTAAWIMGLDWRARYIEEPAVIATYRRYMAPLGFFLASGIFCFSEDHACSWHCYLDLGTGGIKCEGMLVASDTRKLALLESLQWILLPAELSGNLGLFLASGNWHGKADWSFSCSV